MYPRTKALIAMSGGVDSSVAALLSKDAGLECVGVTMKLFDNEDVGEGADRPCCSLTDAADAARVCAEIGMPHYVFDFTKDFEEQVIAGFVSAYIAGTTPNPCIDCNRFIKYDRLFQRMKDMGFDCVVTGHYARTDYDESTGRYLLRTGLDDTKDQSYVLYALTQEQLAHTQFPLGSLTKSEARKIAEAHGFVNANKPDSQDICFVIDGDYGRFIESYTGNKYPSGNFLDTDGRVIGEHHGIIHYTIGQRRGLGKAFGRPMFVCEIRPETNEIVLGEDEDLLGHVVTARDINLISVAQIDEPMRVTAKIRYNQKAQPATVVQTGPDEITVTFDEPVRAITRGQALVLYDGDIIVGGGTII
jgi:tRNA-specific 2-thiouridylase